MLHVIPPIETVRGIPYAIAHKAVLDLRFDAIGAAATISLRNGNVLRGFIAAGETYRVHPIDIAGASGEIFELPTAAGLQISDSPEFRWQLDGNRRLLTVPMAVNALRAWAEQNLETLPTA